MLMFAKPFYELENNELVLKQCPPDKKPIEEKDLPKLYSGAKLLLFPSLLEGFGLPIVEAMACGCPVVTSNRNPMQELVGPEQLTIDPLNPDEIARICKVILSDNSYRNAMIQKGLERSKKFNWEITAKDTYDFITSAHK
jgi:glycosyltransferase involved in cell wall biosynthesis